MAGRTSPTFRKRRLGRRLQQLREGAGMTLEDAAPKLDKTRSSLHRIESGETRADVHLIRSMMDLYDRYEPDLLELSRDAGKRGWWRQYGLEDMGYVDVETEACAVREFNALNVPGLLQTEAYVRAQLRAGAPRTDERLRKDVAVRMIRQERLVDEDPLELTAIVDEAALHREVGGPEVMGEQLWHLIAMAERPAVTLQVLPFRSGAHDAMIGSFIVLQFPEHDEPDLLYIGHVAGGLHLERPEQVREAKLVFDRLRSQALAPEDSVALIARLAGAD